MPPQLCPAVAILLRSIEPYLLAPVLVAQLMAFLDSVTVDEIVEFPL